MPAKLTHEEYIKQLKIHNPHVEVLEQYKNNNTLLLHYCHKHHNEFYTKPKYAIKNIVCTQCSKDRKSQIRIKTNEQYIKELKDNKTNLISLETYINDKTKILHRCLCCGHEWKITPNEALKRHGCPRCNKHFKKTNEDFVKLMSQNNPNIELLENHLNSKRTIKCRCKKHNVVWDASKEYILQGGGCYLCGREKTSLQLRKTHQEFINELIKVDSSIIPLEDYQTIQTKIKFKCLLCNNEWETTPSNVLHGYGCPVCSIKKSIGEKIIQNWLILHNIKFLPQMKFDNCKDNLCLPFDFYLIDENKCIEYDGIQHFRPIEYFGGQENFKYTQRHDQIKTEYCKINNIPLLRIPYYANIEEELENFLLN